MVERPRIFAIFYRPTTFLLSLEIHSCSTVLPSPAEQVISLARPKFIKLSQNYSNELIVIWRQNIHNIELNITQFPAVYEHAFYEFEPFISNC